MLELKFDVVMIPDGLRIDRTNGIAALVLEKSADLFYEKHVSNGVDTLGKVLITGPILPSEKKALVYHRRHASELQFLKQCSIVGIKRLLLL